MQNLVSECKPGCLSESHHLQVSAGSARAQEEPEFGGLQEEARGGGKQ